MVFNTYFDVLGKIKSPINIEFTGLSLILNKSWRRKRDSNPRRCDPQQFSRLPHSTTLPFLLECLIRYSLNASANIISFFDVIKQKIDFFKNNNFSILCECLCLIYSVHYFYKKINNEYH